MEEHDCWEKFVGNHWALDLVDQPHALVAVIETKISRAVLAEQRRIIKIIEDEVSEWVSHDGDCDCKVRGEEGSRLIRIIKGGKE